MSRKLGKAINDNVDNTSLTLDSRLAAGNSGDDNFFSGDVNKLVEIINPVVQLESTEQITGFDADVNSLANIVAADLIKLTYLTPFVVGATSAYTSVQAAINAAAFFATSTSPQNVLITAGTYTENVSLKSNVHLISCGSPGSVKIIGNGIFNPTGSGQLVECTGITFQTPASASGAAFSVQGSNFGNVNIHNCTFNGTTGTAVECTNANSNFNIFDSQINSSTGYSAFNCTGGVIEVINCFTTGSTTASTISSNGQIDFTSGTLLDSFVLTGSATCVINNIIAQSPSTNSFININSGCSANIFNSSITCGALGGYWATGTGTIKYNDLSASLGSAKKIASTLTVITQTLLTNQISFDGGATSIVAEDVANKSTTTSLGTSNTLYPTQNAVKTYVDTATGTTLLKANNLSDLALASTARTNLGLGNAAVKGVSDNTKSTLAAVTGSFTANHAAIFSDTAGTIQDAGAAPMLLGKHTATILMGGLNPSLTNGVTIQQVESSTNKNNYRGWQYPNGTTLYAHLQYGPPKSWDGQNVTIRLFFVSSLTGAGQFTFNVQTCLRNNGDAFDSAFSTANAITTAINNATTYALNASAETALTLGGSAFSFPSLLEIRIGRSSTDTGAAPALLVAIELNFTLNAGNDA